MEEKKKIIDQIAFFFLPQHCYKFFQIWLYSSFVFCCFGNSVLVRCLCEEEAVHLLLEFREETEEMKHQQQHDEHKNSNQKVQFLDQHHQQQHTSTICPNRNREMQRQKEMMVKFSNYKTSIINPKALWHQSVVKYLARVPFNK